MPKHKQRGKASFAGFDYDLFIQTAMSEICPFLDEDLRATILMAPWESVHTAISDCLPIAESRIARGGGPSYIALRQLEALFKKNPDWRALSEDDRRVRALDKFAQAEQACRRTNKRLSFYRKHWSRQNLACEVLNRASLMCQEILGPLTPAMVEQMFDECKFGSGATFEHKGELVNLNSKLSSHHTVTQGAKVLLCGYLLRSPELYEFLSAQQVTTVRGNRLTTVPKDRSIDRVIAIEPAWNVFMQLGVDAIMKKKLRKTGVFLRDQTRNFAPAREGSISGEFSTIDLSSASDSVSTQIVSWLIPPDWVALLNRLRSPEYTIDGKSWHKYEKFSSMGNATTFPVESLLFYCVAKACYEIVGLDPSTIRVYGDDLIVHRRVSLLLMEVLAFAGFTPNAQKSFVVGPFRESCGRDYLNGLNVRPVYIRKVPTTVEDVYSTYNRLLIGSMIPLPRTLNYVESCIVKPHRGPLYMAGGMPSIDGILSDKHEWDMSKGFRTQNYFVSFEAPKAVFHLGYQRLSYRFKLLDRKFREVPTDGFSLDTLYRSFLYTLRSDAAVNPKRFKWFQRESETDYWPAYRDLVGWHVRSRSF